MFAGANAFGAMGGTVGPVTFDGAGFGNAAAPIAVPSPNHSDLDAKIAETRDAAACIDSTISTLLVRARCMLRHT